jgi:glycerophosphoryl diester phosphodiesterase
VSSSRAYQIVERFVQGKAADAERCEDVVVVTDAFAAVIDGATSKSPRRPGTVSPGRMLALALAEVIHDLDPVLDARSAVDQLTERAHTLTQAHPHVTEHAAASVVMLSFMRGEVWRVGECLFRIGSEEFASRNRLEANVAAVRAAYNQIQLLSGATLEELRARDVGRELILPILKSQHALLNLSSESTFAFGAIDGRRVPDRFIEVHSIPAGRCDVVLCSDGYPRALPSLAEAEEHLAKLLAKDPLCISDFLATKGMGLEDLSYDDRAFVRLRCDE